MLWERGGVTSSGIVSLTQSRLEVTGGRGLGKSWRETYADPSASVDDSEGAVAEHLCLVVLEVIEALRRRSLEPANVNI